VVRDRVEIVRVYDDPGRKRGEHRVLVDRLWPRGLSKDAVDYDDWPKDVAPSSELRRWYGHDPERFSEFSRRYRRELTVPPAARALAHLRGMTGRQLVLLTATRDVEHSGATVLRVVLEHESR
jgi:uncharacterized protein YeaO (DUF488 family)